MGTRVFKVCLDVAFLKMWKTARFPLVIQASAAFDRPQNPFVLNAGDWTWSSRGF